VNRPEGSDPDEDKDAGVPGTPSVGSSEDVGRTAPQAGQKRLPPGVEVLHLGHELIEQA